MLAVNIRPIFLIKTSRSDGFENDLNLERICFLLRSLRKFTAVLKRTHLLIDFKPNGYF